MSTVPPSPPWPMTRMSVCPFAFSAAAMPLATAGAFAKSEWTQGSRHDDSGYGVDHTTVGRAQRGVEDVPCAERLAATLAGTVTGGERVRALLRGLHRPVAFAEQTVTDREAAHLEELDRAARHQCDPPATIPMSRRMFSA
jgi:hypothetical protein